MRIYCRLRILVLQCLYSASYQYRSAVRNSKSETTVLRFSSDPGSGRRLLFSLTVFFLEAFDTASRINQLLLAGEERMTTRADFDVDLFLGRTRCPRGAASTNHSTFLILRMDSCFHFRFSFTSNGQKSFIQLHCMSGSINPAFTATHKNISSV